MTIKHEVEFSSQTLRSGLKKQSGVEDFLKPGLRRSFEYVLETSKGKVYQFHDIIEISFSNLLHDSDFLCLSSRILDNFQKYILKRLRFMF